MMRPMTGAALMSQFGLSRIRRCRIARRALATSCTPSRLRSSAGSGTTLSQHAWLFGSGGSGHLPLHAGQPGGASTAGQNDLHSFFFGSNVGVVARLDHLGHARRASADRESRPWSSRPSIGPALSLKSTVSLYLPASPRRRRVDADEVLALRVLDASRCGCAPRLLRLPTPFDCDDRRVLLVEHVERELEAGTRRRATAA